MKQLFTSITVKTLFLILISSFFTVVFVALLIYFKPRLATDLLDFLSPSPQPVPLALKGIAVIGDSQSDEYRTDDSRGVTYASTTLNWVEHLAKFRNLPFGSYETYDEPRRSGYEYNWARTGATTLSMIESGQHTGVADQIKSGQVNVVVIYIGANDFAPFVSPDGYEAIYDGQLEQVEIFEKINTIHSRIKTTVDLLQDSGNVRIILVSIPDWGRNPAMRIAFPIPYQRARVTDVINSINSDLQKLADEQGLLYFDINDFYEDLQSERDDKKIALGDIVLENTLPSENPKHIFLDDGIHPGSAVNALFANEMIEVLNTVLVEPITPFSTQEMQHNSGL